MPRSTTWFLSPPNSRRLPRLVGSRHRHSFASLALPQYLIPDLGGAKQQGTPSLAQLTSQAWAA
eukprot:10208618-Heterocapsa_arctica.AAC.1